jgi:hypothetical protein
VTRRISARADCVRALLGRLRSMAPRDGVSLSKSRQSPSRGGYSRSAGRLDNGRQCDAQSGQDVRTVGWGMGHAADSSHRADWAMALNATVRPIQGRRSCRRPHRSFDPLPLRQPIAAHATDLNSLASGNVSLTTSSQGTFGCEPTFAVRQRAGLRGLRPGRTRNTSHRVARGGGERASFRLLIRESRAATQGTDGAPSAEHPP